MKKKGVIFPSTLLRFNFYTPIYFILYLFYFQHSFAVEFNFGVYILFFVACFLVYSHLLQNLKNLISSGNKTIVFLCLCFTILFFLNANKFNLLLLGLAIVLLFFYYFEFKNFSLRRIFILKPITVSAVWVCLLSSATFSNSVPDLMFIFKQFLFIYMLTIPFDYADSSEDVHSGINNFYAQKPVVTALLLLALVSIWIFLNLITETEIFVALNSIFLLLSIYTSIKVKPLFWKGVIGELPIVILLISDLYLKAA